MPLDKYLPTINFMFGFMTALVNFYIAKLMQSEVGGRKGKGLQAFAALEVPKVISRRVAIPSP